MEHDPETGLGGCDGGHLRGGSNVVGGADGRRSLDINTSGGGGGRTARSINRRSGDGGAGGGGRRARHNNRRREQEWMIILAIHVVYLAANGLLYMVIKIKFQNLNNPFETHMAMTSSVVAFCVYFCAAALQTRLVYTNNKLEDLGLLNHVLVCSGILSPLSNVLVFLPNIVGWVVVVLFVFATTILLAYDVFKLMSNYISERNNISNNNATPTSESVALEMSTGINHNATTSESLEISIENNNETSRNNNDVVEMRTGNNFTGSTRTLLHSFLNQGFGS